MNPNKNQRFTRVTHLFAVLHSLASQLQTEMGDLRGELEDQFGIDAVAKPMQVVTIIERVAHTMGVSPMEIFGRGRARRITDARHIAMWCVAKRMRTTVERIASYFDVDHTAVVYALKKVDVLAGADSTFRTSLDACAVALGIPAWTPEGTKPPGKTLAEIFTAEAEARANTQRSA